MHSKYTKTIYIDGEAQNIFHFVRDENTIQMMNMHMISLEAYQKAEHLDAPVSTIMIWLSQMEVEKILAIDSSMLIMPSVWGEGILVHHGMRDDETFHWLDTIDL